MGFGLLDMLEATPINVYLYGCLNKDRTYRYANVDERKLRRPQPCTKNYKQQRIMKAGEIFFSRKWTTIGYIIRNGQI